MGRHLLGFEQPGRQGVAREGDLTQQFLVFVKDEDVVIVRNETTFHLIVRLQLEVAHGLELEVEHFSTIPMREEHEGCEKDDQQEHVAHHLSLRADRKSTRLNSSHSQISYAVFCLK